ncbi:MAG TPA: flagellar hook-basal body complex protein FliE [Bdellovibrionota bacterium]|jgi:flagellar hook-basal body complex protein FliE
MANLGGIDFGNKSMIGSQYDSGLGRIRESSENAIGVNESSESGEAKTFGQFMKELAQDANTASLNADQKLQEVAAGRNKDLHGAVLAMEKADVQFRLLTQVRNKVIEAYREIMRMQV